MRIDPLPAPSGSRPVRARPVPAAESTARRDFRGRRWLGIALRTLHLVGVVLTAIAIFGEPRAEPGAGAALILASGAALYGLDLWHRRALWRELAGVFVLVKLAVVAAMLVAPQLAAALFWLLVVMSSIVSHAPRTFRHARLVRS